MPRMLVAILVGVFVGILSGNARATPMETSRYKRAAKQHALTIISNAPSAIVMADGLFVGQAGAPFDATPGPLDLVVMAPGHIPRKIRVLVQDRHAIVRVVLASSKGKDVEINYQAAQSFETSRSLEEVPSLCAAFQESQVMLDPTVMLGCRRRSVRDDVLTLGPDWLGQRVHQGIETGVGTDGTSSVDSRRRQLWASLRDAPSDAFYWQAESLFAEFPGDNDVAGVLALSAALRQDCRRVIEVELQQEAHGASSAGIFVAKGLCMEMAVQPSKAASLYRQVHKQLNGKGDGGEEGEGGAPSLYIHMARLLREGGRSPIATLSACARSNPAYYPCYEAAAQIYLLEGKKRDAEKIMTLYHQRTRVALKEIFKGDVDAIESATLMEAYQQRPVSFELAAAVYASGLSVAPKTIDFTATLISDARLALQLLPRLEAKADARTLRPVYETLTALLPENPTGWVRLGEVYRLEDRCAKSLEMTRKALALIQHAGRRAALYISTTDCLLRLGYLAEAEKNLLEVIHGSAELPAGSTWKVYYNLGIVRERLKKSEEALAAFEMALAQDLPDELRKRVEAKVRQARRNQKSPGTPSPKAPGEDILSH